MHRSDLQIAIDGHRIDETDRTKVLVVIIDRKLNWKTHISYITGQNCQRHWCRYKGQEAT